MRWMDASTVPGGLLLAWAAVCAFGVWRYACFPPRGRRSPRRGWGLCAGLAAALGLWISWCLHRQPAQACAVCVDWQAADRAVQAWALQPAHADWMPWVVALTRWGDVEWIAALGVAVAAVLAWRGAWPWLGAWAVGLVGVGLSVRWSKLWVQRERPVISWVLEDSYSFPSGHSAGSWVCYGLMAWAVLRCGTGRWRVPAAVAAASLALAIGASRAVLGVHYLSDVVAGWCLGLLWMAVALVLADVLHSRCATRRVPPCGPASGTDDR